MSHEGFTDVHVRDKQVGMGAHVQPHSLSQGSPLVMTMGVTHEPSQAGRNSRNGPKFTVNSQVRALQTQEHFHVGSPPPP